MRHEFKPAAWALMLILAIATMGCVNDSRPATTLDYLNETEAALTAAWETLGNAMDLGYIPENSTKHMQFYTILDRADQMLDAAWESYAVGEDGVARTQADLAMALYIEIRPTLLAAAEGR